MIELNVLSMSHRFNIYKGLALFLLSFLLTYFIIPILINIAYKFNIVDKPDGKLKIHELITPYLGGIAIFVNVFIYLILYKQFDFFYIFISLFLVMLLGLFDDIYKIRPLTKFIGQILALLVILFGSFYFKNVFINYFITFLINIFWCLSIINAFNLVDVMDGLCTSLAIFPAISFVCISIFYNQPNLAFLLIMFIASLFGFLLYNLPPALIYLGDSGSMYIGCFLSIIPFLIDWESTFMGLLSSIAILIIPIVELICLILIRIYKEIPFYLGSRDHFTHYLINKKWSKKNILFYCCLINVFVQFVALLFVFNFINLYGLLGSLLIILIIWLCTIYG